MTSFAVIENPHQLTAYEQNKVVFNSLKAALQRVEHSTADSTLLYEVNFWLSGVPELPEEWDNYDLIHSGLSLGGAEVFKTLWFTSTNWLFLNPRSDRTAASWKATPHWCLIRPGQVRDLGGFDPSYSSGEAALMDLAYRLLTAGGKTGHVPVECPVKAQLKIPFEDEVNFIYRRVNPKSAFYAVFWSGLTSVKYLRSVKAFLNARRLAQDVSIQSNLELRLNNTHLLSDQKSNQVDGFSAIIPTIDRYEYVQKSIESLLSQRPSPNEIIVVDQTPKDRRMPEVYQKYDSIKVRVCYLDQAGQSNARNTGVQQAQHDWCLLFDDDAEARENMIAQHIKVIESSDAAGSTGVALAPWKDRSFISKGNRVTRLSNLLDTGNCFIKKQAFLSVTGLDRAYDHGSGADHDLGLRLYLNGEEVIFNPQALHTHYKAQRGGLRTYGVIWRHSISLFGAFPQPTLVYTIQRFYPKKYWLAQYLKYYFKADTSNNLFLLVWLWFSMPYRLIKSVNKSRHIHQQRSVP